MYTRRFAAMVAAALSFTSLSPAFAAFSDVSSSTQYDEAIQSLLDSGVIEGYDDGTFKPTNRINRAEFLKIVLESRGDISEKTDCFPDVDDEWFAKYVCTAKDEGIVTGYPDGSFKPEQEINFVEAAKILALAYDQSISAYSPDWYEPYARALESSSAIPPSIGTLEQRVSRGEMAEMMWRLSENVTDEPAKGYLNVKYPEMTVNMAADTAQTAKSCADLRAFTEEAGRGYGTDVMYYREMDGIAPPMAPQAGGAKATSNAESAQSDDSYSQTNVQVAGVDEGDIVKTDGEFLYVVRNQEVRIVRVTDPKNLKQVATIKIDDTGFSPTDLYVDGDRLVVIGSSWGTGGDVHIMNKMAIWPGPWYNQNSTVVRLYDVSNAESPKLTRTVSFEGNQVSTRRIEDKLYVVVNQGPRYWGGPIPLLEKADADDLVPTVTDSAHGDKPVAAVPCNDVMILPRVPSPTYLIVGVVPLTSSAEVQRSAILGSGENVYASLDNLYVAGTEWNYDWSGKGDTQQRTRLYRFAFDGGGVTFRAQGGVSGRILNQFSMDEHENNFRIATTIDTQWLPNNEQRASSNNLYVLNGDMEQVGSIEDIAPGEQIYSTRFLGDRTYMVTFRQIDPLFVIDTSDPRNPIILGKLKIPGFSNYLHPYDEDHIIGFGKDTEESKDGTTAWQQGMKVALFDVSDVEHPIEMHKIVIGDRGTDSPLLSNHKALLFEKDRDLLTFPINVHKISDTQKQGSDPDMAWGDSVFQGAQVYSLTLKDGFELRGSITHYTDEDWLKAGGYVYGKDIDRVVRVDDSLLTVSMWGVKSNTEEDIDEEGSMVFDEPVSASGGSCPDESDPDVHYVSKDPESCARLRFSCIEGTEAFSDLCGCGCK